MIPHTPDLKSLLPHGSISVIAQKLGMSVPAVSQALKAAKPSSKAVQLAMRMAEESGALATAQALAALALAK